MYYANEILVWGTILMPYCRFLLSIFIYSAAVIGPDFSSEAEALSRLLSSFPEKYRLLQLGYAPTSASLKDKATFRNFFRTIPPDNIQVQVNS